MPDPMPGSDESSKRVWDAFVERLTPRLLAWLNLRISAELRGRIEPIDIVQAIWFRVVHKFDPEDGSDSLPMDAQVFAIARYVLLEECRRFKSLQRLRFADGHTTRMHAHHDITAHATTICRRLAKEEGMERFFAQIESWSETDREILRLVGLEGESPAEAGSRLGMTQDAVARRWHRLRERMRSMSLPEGVLTP